MFIKLLEKQEGRYTFILANKRTSGNNAKDDALLRPHGNTMPTIKKP